MFSIVTPFAKGFVSVRLQFFICLIWFGLGAAVALAQTSPALPQTGTAHSTTDGDTIVLSSGQAVRLVGIMAPKLSLGRPHVTDWPLANEAKSFLEQLVAGKNLRLVYGPNPIDRHGRLLAHLYLPDGRWVQGEILRHGMARVYILGDNRNLATELFGIEAQAQKTKTGIWADDFYAIRNPNSILQKKYLDSYQIIEGEVLAVAEVKKNIYLNFGADWKTDFTAVIPLAARKNFTAAKIKPLDLTSKKVRVRGWVESRYGPSIALTHPEMLQILP